MSVLLGWEAAEHATGDDAPLRLAACLARAERASVVVATVVPPEPDGPDVPRLDREHRRWRDGVIAQRQAEAVTVLRAAGVEDVRTAVVPAPSVPAGLVEAVRREGAELLVLGASAEAPEGRFSAGSVAERLLHSSPVPLALPPRGWDDPAAPARLVCAWAGTARAGEALIRARALAGRWGVPVRLVTFVPERAAVLPSETGLRTEQVVSEEWVADVRGLLEEGLPARGAGWAGALAAVPWEPGDVLVVGSSRSGPPARVFLGSSAAKLLRAAPVPVLVVGRAADDSPTSS